MSYSLPALALKRPVTVVMLVVSLLGLGVIALFLSTRFESGALEYCRELKSGRKWAGFTIPVAVDTASGQVTHFDKNPVWGRIFYPHFKRLILEISGQPA